MNRIQENNLQWLYQDIISLSFSFNILQSLFVLTSTPSFFNPCIPHMLKLLHSCVHVLWTAVNNGCHTVATITTTNLKNWKDNKGRKFC
jgi:hypothetical protein